MPREGQTGTLPDGTRVIYMDGQVRRLNEGGLADMGGGYYKSPQGRSFRQGPRGGFEQIGGPTQSQIDSAAQKGQAINAALGSLDMFDQKLRETKVTGPFGWMTNPNDLAEAKQLADDLMLRLKEQPYNLGVLNGPDLQILQAVIADPTTIKDAAFRKSVVPRLRNIAAKLGDTYRGDMQAFQASGGGAAAIPNLFRSDRSTYTPQEWGQAGLVPAAKAPAKRGDAPRTRPATTGARQPFKGRYGTVYEE
jgi:hypothetical protein